MDNFPNVYHLTMENHVKLKESLYSNKFNYFNLMALSFYLRTSAKLLSDSR